MKLKNITPLQLALIIALIILIVPALLSLPYLFNWEIFDLTGKGEIGDAIGGITSPFINGLAAILVFVAFKEQIKANKLIQEQQYFQHIYEQILRLEKDELDLSGTIENIKKDLSNSK
ncbi:MAG: hypothetical protein PF444_03445 [Bacteroidales bacterium]|jgi:hypothetical protein|nr:hypothetical protein [Bacteroidales bacterium]